MPQKPHGAGKSSFDLVDSALLFREIGLEKGITFLDVACGPGTYSLAASPLVGDTGSVFAVDLWQDGIESLRQQLAARGIANTFARVADVSRHIPVETASVDVALMAMALHDLMRDRTEQGALKELKRVLKPRGRLAVVEFKKQEGPPGPPIDIRLAPDVLERCLLSCGFRVRKSLDLGPHSYLTVGEPK